jgi:hypothetical protein
LKNLKVIEQYMKKLTKYFILVPFIALSISACKKQDSTYRKFVIPGGVNYAGKAINPYTENGHHRVRVSWLPSGDPNVVSARVYWNNYTDSVSVDIPKSADTISVLIDDLPEKKYTFFVRTFNKKGERSIPVEVLGESYGEKYESGLLNRVVLSSLMIPGTDNGLVNIQWGDADISNGAIATEVRYMQSSGSLKTVSLDVESSELIIRDFKSGSKYSYRTQYRPDSTSMDTFFTQFVEQDNQELYGELPKGAFKMVRLAGDASDPNDPNDWAMNKLWDGRVASPGALAQSGSTPRTFTIDLGYEVELTKFILWQSPDRIYMSGNPRDFEVWGSDDPNPNGSWDNWTKLGTFHSIKPSGLPLGQTNAEDQARARDGETYQFPANSPRSRYLRFKVLESWEPGTPYTCLAEAAFFTIEKK